MKRIFLVMIALFMLSATGFAQSGTTGPLTWDMSNGTLTVSGEGAMPDYSYPDYAPWYAYSSSITTVLIGDGVTSIGNWAFYHCIELTSVTIPNSVTSIGDWAFISCDGLTSVTIPNSVISIGEGAFEDCFKLTDITIPNGVTSIEDYTFNGCSSLASVTIPESVTSIGHDAFNSCSGLTSVTIPNSVTSIGDMAFYECSKLTSVTIGNSVTSIGNSAFYHCIELISITIPESVTSIGDGAFFRCSALTAIDVSENNTVYASENGVLFNKVKSALIQYPAGKQDVSYNIPSSVTSIREGAFSHCSGLTSVTIPNSVTIIEGYAFNSCSGLTSVTIPNSVTRIGGYAFSTCIGLTSVTIGNSVTSIGGYAFNDCTGLTSVTNLNPTPQNIDNIYVFYGVDLSKVTLYVPASSVEDYKAADTWKNFKEIKAYIPSAIESPAVGSSINVYPNPVTESFRINGITAPTEVIITDLSGRIVLQQTVEGGESVVAGNLPNGVYIVRVNGKTLKVVKR
ncbi:MAG: leucine-rich repeat domain-containing protein [Dysgonamonadaceae bacterium]|jgi:hypothetical protein|nr:leucine-rich repeat domain-containing protein [Dysgonamonadaceae bacterium]